MTDDPYSNSIDIGSIESSSQMFAEHSVQELLQLNLRINKDIQNKRQELRNLVGSKYRDLLNVADNIITMDELVQKQDTDLTNLVFQNSNYTSKILANKIQFQSSISNFKKQDLIHDNAQRVARSMLDDLEDLYSFLLKLVDEFDNWNKELNDEEETFETAEQLVDVSIFIYMINFLFKDTFVNNHMLRNRFKSTKIKILNIVKYMLTDLVVDGENELVLNLLLSYTIITLESPLQVFQSFLNARFIKFQKFQLNKFEFQNSLKYLFNTISYINLFKTKLVTMATRVIHLNNSSNKNSKSWFKLPYVAKWKNWIENYNDLNDIQFPQSVSELRALTEDKIEETLNDWKFEISEHYFAQISFKNNDLSTQVEKISIILNGFKNFTSLVNLKLQNGNFLIDELIQKWQQEYLEIVKIQILQYEHITQSILKVHTSNEDDSNGTTTTTTIVNIFDKREDDLSDIFSYLHKISETASNLIGPQKTLLLEIDNFYQKIQILAYTLIQLLRLKHKILKPVLSIDDTEDEQFWNSIASKIADIYKFFLEKINTDLGKIQDDFTQQMIKISEIGIAIPSQASKLLRCLIALNNKPKLSEYFQNKENDKDINIIQPSAYAEFAKSNTYSSLILNFIKPLLQTLAKSSIRDLELDIYQRFDKMSEVDDLMIWDKTTDEKYIPVQPSYNTVVKLYKLSETILQNNENKDILEVEEINVLKIEMITGVITELIDNLDQKLSIQDNVSVVADEENAVLDVQQSQNENGNGNENANDEVNIKETSPSFETPKNDDDEVTIKETSPSPEISKDDDDDNQVSKNKKKKNKKKKKKGKGSQGVDNVNGDEQLVSTEGNQITESIESVENDHENSAEVLNTETKNNDSAETAETAETVDENNVNESNENNRDKDEVAAETSNGVESDSKSNEQSPVVVESNEDKQHEIDDIDKKDLFTQQALLTYADLVYLSLFLNKKQFFEDLSEELTNDALIVKARRILKLDELYDDVDMGKIHKNVFEFFKSNKSLYIF